MYQKADPPDNAQHQTPHSLSNARANFISILFLPRPERWFPWRRWVVLSAPLQDEVLRHRRQRLQMPRPILQCNAWFWHLAYGLLPIYHTWWVCFCGDAGSQARLRVQEQAKHQYLVFVDAMGVGYCMDIIDVNQVEHSPCSFSLLG